MTIMVKDVGHVSNEDAIKKISEFDKQINAHELEIASKRDNIRQLEKQREQIMKLRETYVEPLVKHLTEGTTLVIGTNAQSK